MELSFESEVYLTREAFYAWVLERPPADVNRYELLNGRVVMTPPAGYPHGATELRLAGVLDNYVRSRGLGIAFGSSQGFELPSGDTFAADASYVSPERWEAGPAPQEGRFLRVVPDLVVEILSRATATHDRGEKKGIYERNGVREYWLVDARARTVRRFVLDEAGRFDLGTVFDESEVLTSVVLDGLEARVADLFPV